MMRKVPKEVMTIGLDLIDSLKEVRLANHKISHAHALLWLINRRVKQKCQYSKNGRSFELLPGEVMSSYEAMSRAWHWDIKTVRSFISGLETGGYVSIKTCYYGVVLTFPRLRLEEVEIDGDLELSGEITSYDVKASSVTSNEVAAQNRLTVTAKVTFMNRKYPEDDFEKSFSAYADFDATNSLDAVESTLCEEIIDKLVEDIFNASVANW